MTGETAHPHPRYRIADLFRAHRQELDRLPLALDQRRLVGAIVLCRTPALGGQLYRCAACGTEHPVYHSCRKRGCPTCQALAQEAWIAQRAERLLPIRHFHLVFTLPAQLRALALAHPVKVFGAFFRIVGGILEELGRTRLQAGLGWTLVLHTWKRDMGVHPHIHALVTAGGLALDGRSWVRVKGGYLFPGEVMGELLRGKVLAALRELRAEGSFPDLEDPAFDRLMAALAGRKRWVVHAEPPFRDASHLLGYLGRYVYRIALSDARLVAVTSERVTFTTRHGQTETLAPLTFLTRFLQHVLPAGFHKVRHGGLYASTQKGGRLERAQALLAAEAGPQAKERVNTERAARVEQLRSAGHRCPDCGGLLVRTGRTLPRQRAPPGAGHA